MEIQKLDQAVEALAKRLADRLISKGYEVKVSHSFLVSRLDVAFKEMANRATVSGLDGEPTLTYEGGGARGLIGAAISDAWREIKR